MLRDILGRNGDGHALLCETHLLRESGVWLPRRRLAGCDLFQHFVDLFEREALGLGHEEVCEGEGEAAEGAPEEEDFGAEVGVALLGADEVWGDDCDDLWAITSAGALNLQRGMGDLRSSRTNWKRWTGLHHESGWAEGRSRQSQPMRMVPMWQRKRRC